MKQLLALAAIPLLINAVAVSGFKVTSDKENVVASRLEGAWVPDAPIYERLKGGPPGKQAKPVTFRSAPEVAEKVPERYGEFLNGKTIYMGGYMKWGDDEQPFLLTDVHGNPHIIWFRERNGDPMGDAESCNVMLAPAKDPKDDLLFLSLIHI